MACFVAPGAEAVVVTAVAQVLIARERRTTLSAGSNASAEAQKNRGVSFGHKLMWLSYLLWGGCLLLAYEHLWHGEVVPFFPFLTAMSNAADTQVMLGEIASVGGAMCLLLTAVWVLMLAATAKILRARGPIRSAS